MMYRCRLNFVLLSVPILPQPMFTQQTVAELSDFCHRDSLESTRRLGVSCWVLLASLYCGCLGDVRGNAVKKFLLVPLFLILAGASVFAGGDKVRGEKGEGDVNQVQVQDPPPFQESDAVSWIAWLLGIGG